MISLITLDWIWVGWLNGFVNPELTIMAVLSVLFSIGVLFFLKKTIPACLLVCAGAIHIQAIFSDAYFFSGYSLAIHLVDASLLITCIADKYGRDLIINGCRALNIPLRNQSL